MQRYLAERLSFDQLFRMSEPKRVMRSHKVKGPPLEIDAYQDAVYHIFNFKSYPSTTGLRHKGYIKFLRPRRGGQKALQHLNCIVDCTCPDYRYRWAWANKQRGASRVGPQSINQAHNRAPRITNPTSRPGLCKHILAAREYIYGLLSSFPNDGELDAAEKLNKLTAYATRRWINFPQQMAAAREREARYAAGVQARNIGQEPYQVPEPPAAEPEVAEPDALDAEGREPGDEEAYDDIVPPEIADAPELAQVPPPPPPESFATRVRPPSERGRTFPQGGTPAPAKKKKNVRRIRKDTPVTADKTASATAAAGFRSPAEYNFARRQGLGDSLGHGIENEKSNCVVMTNGLTKMNTLTEAQRIISELEQDELSALRNAGNEDDAGAPGDALPPVDDLEGGDFPPAEGDEQIGAAMGGEPMGDMGGGLPPSEAPVSDTAVGADTEGSAALGLLREIRDFLGQLSSALVPQEPEGEEAIPGGGAAPIEGEGEGELEIPVDDPEAESEEEGGEGEGGGEEFEEEEEEIEEEPASKE